MKDTLYITDLDGTLLLPDSSLSSYAIKTINQVIEQGGHFSIATGRSTNTAARILSQLNLVLPVALSNGTVLYDPVEGKIISVAQLPTNSLELVEKELKRQGITVFLYTLENNLTSVYHLAIKTEYEATYKENRAPHYDNRFSVVNSFSDMATDKVPYFATAYGEYDKLSAVGDIATKSGMNTALYKDVYHTPFYMLDIFSSSASKLTGMNMIQKIARASRTVSFGDNDNDLPMIEGANESYVPENGAEEVKAVATAVIGHHSNDSVAKFIASRFQLD